MSSTNVSQINFASGTPLLGASLPEISVFDPYNSRAAFDYITNFFPMPLGTTLTATNNGAFSHVNAQFSRSSNIQSFLLEPEKFYYQHIFLLAIDQFDKKRTALEMATQWLDQIHRQQAAFSALLSRSVEGIVGLGGGNAVVGSGGTSSSLTPTHAQSTPKNSGGGGGGGSVSPMMSPAAVDGGGGGGGAPSTLSPTSSNNANNGTSPPNNNDSSASAPGASSSSSAATATATPSVGGGTTRNYAIILVHPLLLKDTSMMMNANKNSSVKVGSSGNTTTANPALSSLIASAVADQQGLAGVHPALSGAANNNDNKASVTNRNTRTSFFSSGGDKNASSSSSTKKEASEFFSFFKSSKDKERERASAAADRESAYFHDGTSSHHSGGGGITASMAAASAMSGMATTLGNFLSSKTPLEVAEARTQEFESYFKSQNAFAGRVFRFHLTNTRQTVKELMVEAFSGYQQQLQAQLRFEQVAFANRCLQHQQMHQLQQQSMIGGGLGRPPMPSSAGAAAANSSMVISPVSPTTTSLAANASSSSAASSSAAATPPPPVSVAQLPTSPDYGSFFSLLSILQKLAENNLRFGLLEEAMARIGAMFGYYYNRLEQMAFVTHASELEAILYCRRSILDIKSLPPISALSATGKAQLRANTNTTPPPQATTNGLNATSLAILNATMGQGNNKTKNSNNGASYPPSMSGGGGNNNNSSGGGGGNTISGPFINENSMVETLLNIVGAEMHLCLLLTNKQGALQRFTALCGLCETKLEEALREESQLRRGAAIFNTKYGLRYRTPTMTTTTTPSSSSTSPTTTAALTTNQFGNIKRNLSNASNNNNASASSSLARPANLGGGGGVGGHGSIGMTPALAQLFMYRLCKDTLDLTHREALLLGTSLRPSASATTTTLLLNSNATGTSRQQQQQKNVTSNTTPSSSLSPHARRPTVAPTTTSTTTAIMSDVNNTRPTHAALENHINSINGSMSPTAGGTKGGATATTATAGAKTTAATTTTTTTTTTTRQQLPATPVADSVRFAGTTSSVALPPPSTILPKPPATVANNNNTSTAAATTDDDDDTVVDLEATSNDDGDNNSSATAVDLLGDAEEEEDRNSSSCCDDSTTTEGSSVYSETPADPILAGLKQAFVGGGGVSELAIDGNNQRSDLAISGSRGGDVDASATNFSGRPQQNRDTQAFFSPSVEPQNQQQPSASNFNSNGRSASSSPPLVFGEGYSANGVRIVDEFSITIGDLCTRTREYFVSLGQIGFGYRLKGQLLIRDPLMTGALLLGGGGGSNNTNDDRSNNNNLNNSNSNNQQATQVFPTTTNAAHAEIYRLKNLSSERHFLRNYLDLSMIAAKAYSAAGRKRCQNVLLCDAAQVLRYENPLRAVEIMANEVLPHFEVSDWPSLSHFCRELFVECVGNILFGQQISHQLKLQTAIGNNGNNNNMITMGVGGGESLPSASVKQQQQQQSLESSLMANGGGVFTNALTLNNALASVRGFDVMLPGYNCPLPLLPSDDNNAASTDNFADDDAIQRQITAGSSNFGADNKSAITATTATNTTTQRHQKKGDFHNNKFNNTNNKLANTKSIPFDSESSIERAILCLLQTITSAPTTLTPKRRLDVMREAPAVFRKLSLFTRKAEETKVVELSSLFFSMNIAFSRRKPTNAAIAVAAGSAHCGGGDNDNNINTCNSTSSKSQNNSPLADNFNSFIVNNAANSFASFATAAAAAAAAATGSPMLPTNDGIGSSFFTTSNNNDSNNISAATTIGGFASTHEVIHPPKILKTRIDDTFDLCLHFLSPVDLTQFVTLDPSEAIDLSDAVMNTPHAYHHHHRNHHNNRNRKQKNDTGGGGLGGIGIGGGSAQQTPQFEAAKFRSGSVNNNNNTTGNSTAATTTNTSFNTSPNVFIANGGSNEAKSNGDNRNNEAGDSNGCFYEGNMPNPNPNNNNTVYNKFLLQNINKKMLMHVEVTFVSRKNWSDPSEVVSHVLAINNVAEMSFIPFSHVHYGGVSSTSVVIVNNEDSTNTKTATKKKDDNNTAAGKATAVGASSPKTLSRSQQKALGLGTSVMSRSDNSTIAFGNSFASGGGGPRCGDDQNDDNEDKNTPDFVGIGNRGGENDDDGMGGASPLPPTLQNDTFFFQQHIMNVNNNSILLRSMPHEMLSYLVAASSSPSPHAPPLFASPPPPPPPPTSNLMNTNNSNSNHGGSTTPIRVGLASPPTSRPPPAASAAAGTTSGFSRSVGGTPSAPSLTPPPIPQHKRSASSFATGGSSGGGGGTPLPPFVSTTAAGTNATPSHLLLPHASCAAGIFSIRMPLRGCHAGDYRLQSIAICLDKKLLLKKEFDESGGSVNNNQNANGGVGDDDEDEILLNPTAAALSQRDVGGAAAASSSSPSRYEFNQKLRRSAAFGGGGASSPFFPQQQRRATNIFGINADIGNSNNNTKSSALFSENALRAKESDILFHVPEPDIGADLKVIVPEEGCHAFSSVDGAVFADVTVNVKNPLSRLQNMIADLAEEEEEKGCSILAHKNKNKRKADGLGDEASTPQHSQQCHSSVVAGGGGGGGGASVISQHLIDSVGAFLKGVKQVSAEMKRREEIRKIAKKKRRSLLRMMRGGEGAGGDVDDGGRQGVDNNIKISDAASVSDDDDDNSNNATKNMATIHEQLKRTKSSITRKDLVREKAKTPVRCGFATDDLQYAIDRASLTMFFSKLAIADQKDPTFIGRVVVGSTSFDALNNNNNANNNNQQHNSDVNNNPNLSTIAAGAAAAQSPTGIGSTTTAMLMTNTAPQQQQQQLQQNGGGNIGNSSRPMTRSTSFARLRLHGGGGLGGGLGGGGLGIPLLNTAALANNNNNNGPTMAMSTTRRPSHSQGPSLPPPSSIPAAVGTAGGKNGGGADAFNNTAASSPRPLLTARGRPRQFDISDGNLLCKANVQWSTPLVLTHHRNDNNNDATGLQVGGKSPSRNNKLKNVDDNVDNDDDVLATRTMGSGTFADAFEQTSNTLLANVETACLLSARSRGGGGVRPTTTTTASSSLSPSPRRGSGAASSAVGRGGAPVGGGGGAADESEEDAAGGPYSPLRQQQQEDGLVDDLSCAAAAAAPSSSLSTPLVTSSIVGPDGSVTTVHPNSKAIINIPTPKLIIAAPAANSSPTTASSDSKVAAVSNQNINNVTSSALTTATTTIDSSLLIVKPMRLPTGAYCYAIHIDLEALARCRRHGSINTSETKKKKRTSVVPRNGGDDDGAFGENFDYGEAVFVEDSGDDDSSDQNRHDRDRDGSNDDEFCGGNHNSPLLDFKQIAQMTRQFDIRLRIPISPEFITTMNLFAAAGAPNGLVGIGHDGTVFPNIPHPHHHHHHNHYNNYHFPQIHGTNTNLQSTSYINAYDATMNNPFASGSYSPRMPPFASQQQPASFRNNNNSFANNNNVSNNPSLSVDPRNLTSVFNNGGNNPFSFAGSQQQQQQFAQILRAVDPKLPISFAVGRERDMCFRQAHVSAPFAPALGTTFKFFWHQGTCFVSVTLTNLLKDTVMAVHDANLVMLDAREMFTVYRKSFGRGSTVEIEGQDIVEEGSSVENDGNNNNLYNINNGLLNMISADHNKDLQRKKKRQLRREALAARRRRQQQQRVQQQGSSSQASNGKITSTNSSSSNSNALTARQFSALLSERPLLPSAKMSLVFELRPAKGFIPTRLLEDHAARVNVTYSTWEAAQRRMEAIEQLVLDETAKVQLQQQQRLQQQQQEEGYSFHNSNNYYNSSVPPLLTPAVSDSFAGLVDDLVDLVSSSSSNCDSSSSSESDDDGYGDDKINNDKNNDDKKVTPPPLLNAFGRPIDPMKAEERRRKLFRNKETTDGDDASADASSAKATAEAAVKRPTFVNLSVDATGEGHNDDDHHDDNNDAADLMAIHDVFAGNIKKPAVVTPSSPQRGAPASPKKNEKKKRMKKKTVDFSLSANNNASSPFVTVVIPKEHRLRYIANTYASPTCRFVSRHLSIFNAMIHVLQDDYRAEQRLLSSRNTVKTVLGGCGGGGGGIGLGGASAAMTTTSSNVVGFGGGSVNSAKQQQGMMNGTATTTMSASGNAATSPIVFGATPPLYPTATPRMGTTPPPPEVLNVSSQANNTFTTGGGAAAATDTTAAWTFAVGTIIKFTAVIKPDPNNYPSLYGGGGDAATTSASAVPMQPTTTTSSSASTAPPTAAAAASRLRPFVVQINVDESEWFLVGRTTTTIHVSHNSEGVTVHFAAVANKVGPIATPSISIFRPATSSEVALIERSRRNNNNSHETDEGGRVGGGNVLLSPRNNANNTSAIIADNNNNNAPAPLPVLLDDGGGGLPLVLVATDVVPCRQQLIIY